MEPKIVEERAYHNPKTQPDHILSVILVADTGEMYYPESLAGPYHPWKPEPPEDWELIQQFFRAPGDDGMRSKRLDSRRRRRGSKALRLHPRPPKGS